MDIHVSQHGKAVVISIAGAIDALEVGRVSTILSTELKNGNTRLVADLARVDYMNSAGLRSFVQTLKECTRRGGDFRLAGLHPNIRKTLEITGFVGLFKSYPDVAAAVASFT